MNKLVGFAQELLSPFKAAPGSVHEISEEVYEGLRRDAQEGWLFNLTPSAFLPLMFFSPPPKPQSKAHLVPCPVCMAFINGGWTCIKPMTKCINCDDDRTVIAVRVAVQGDGWPGFREAIKKCVKEMKK